MLQFDTLFIPAIPLPALSVEECAWEQAEYIGAITNWHKPIIGASGSCQKVEFIHGGFDHQHAVWHRR